VRSGRRGPLRLRIGAGLRLGERCWGVRERGPASQSRISEKKFGAKANRIPWSALERRPFPANARMLAQGFSVSNPFPGDFRQRAGPAQSSGEGEIAERILQAVAGAAGAGSGLAIPDRGACRGPAVRPRPFAGSPRRIERAGGDISENANRLPRVRREEIPSLLPIRPAAHSCKCRKVRWSCCPYRDSRNIYMQIVARGMPSLVL